MFNNISVVFTTEMSGDGDVNNTLSPAPPPREGAKVAQLMYHTPSLGGGQGRGCY